jgi:uncharacterized protein with von Willebrand factor type A (vWA) domain
MVPAGPKDQVNVDETIYRTMKNAGEIEIVFDRSMKDRLKVILAIDNGGWSMDPISRWCRPCSTTPGPVQGGQDLFFPQHHLRYLWEDPARYRKPLRMNRAGPLDPETRFIVVGDASMAPYELMSRDGSIYVRTAAAGPASNA